MSNKVVTTLFRPQGAFFRLHLGKKEKKQLEAMSQDGAETGALIGEVDAAFAEAEQEAVEHMDMVSYRPSATNAAQLLIITGNALMYHPENEPVQVFSVRNYSVVRDVSGQVIEIMTLETKAYETFAPEVQDKLSQMRAKKEPYEERTPVNIYTRIRLENDGKFHVTQAADLVDISKSNVSYPKRLLPWIPLTWNLVNGEDYGRGLVEDYAGAFHALEVLNDSLLNLAGIMGDLKFLVNPASVVDVEALNSSAPGSYHSGKEGDVTAIELKKQSDAQFIASMIERLERQISHGFLLNSSLTRDAERVTAEEIRMQANELDTSAGGVYSRLAMQWQLPTANVVLDQIKFPADQFGVKIKIITGMDSLSRQGELENLRMFFIDLASLDAVPEEFRGVIHPLRLAAFVGKNRQFDFTQILYTEQELEANRQRELETQAQLEQTKAAGNVAAEAGKAAVQQE